jgi:putative FmdB family regulatory protein
MPTYVYRCQDCGIRFESLRAMKDADSPISCDTCHSTNTSRCLTTFSVKTDSSSSSTHSHSTSGGCGGCSGGSCASCGH